MMTNAAFLEDPVEPPRVKIVQVSPIGEANWLVLFEDGSLWSARLHHVPSDHSFLMAEWRPVKGVSS